MLHVQVAADLKDIANADRLLVVHTAAHLTDATVQGEFDFFARLAPHLEEKGVATVNVELDTPLSQAMLKQNHLHIIFGDQPQYRANCMHVAPSYIPGFWYLDEVGIRANSTLRMRHFHEAGVDWGHAEWFWNGVTSYMLQNNVSQSPQADRVRWDLRPAEAVIFTQERDRQGESYMPTEVMIQNTVRAAKGEQVYVKPHPNSSAKMRQSLERVCHHEGNVTLTEASVHDLALVSKWVVTQNSTAGFEALMQRKPVITCAKTDYHHATLVARTSEDLRNHMHTGITQMADFAFEKYFYWFLSNHCVEPQREDFAEVVWNRLREKAMI